MYWCLLSSSFSCFSIFFSLFNLCLGLGVNRIISYVMIRWVELFCAGSNGIKHVARCTLLMRITKIKSLLTQMSWRMDCWWRHFKEVFIVEGQWDFGQSWSFFHHDLGTGTSQFTWSNVRSVSWCCHHSFLIAVRSLRYRVFAVLGV